MYVKLRAQPLLVMFNKQYLDRISMIFHCDSKCKAVDFFIEKDAPEIKNAWATGARELDYLLTNQGTKEYRKIQEKYSEKIQWMIQSRKNIDVDLKFEVVVFCHLFTEFHRLQK